MSLSDKKTEKRKKPKRKGRVKRFFANLLLFLSVILVFALLCLPYINGDVIENFYQIRSDKVSDNIRIVQLSDLHLYEYGEKNADLIARIQKLKPDLIAITGDMTMNTASESENIDFVVDLCERLGEIAPVYYSLGNHEYDILRNNPECGFFRSLREVGVTVLEDSFAEVVVKNTPIVIGGVYKNAANILRYTTTRKFLNDFTEKEAFKLLLCHCPEVFESAMEDYPVDLALCGHAHGGLIRLPVIGGLYSPDQGFFPKLDRGQKYLCGSNVIISSGLGNSSEIPRFNNRPEIVIVDVNYY